MALHLRALAGGQSAPLDGDGGVLLRGQQGDGLAPGVQTLKPAQFLQRLQHVLGQPGRGVGGQQRFPGLGQLFAPGPGVAAGVAGGVELLHQVRHLDAVEYPGFEPPQPGGLVHDLQRDHQLAQVVEPHAHQEGVGLVLSEGGLHIAGCPPLQEFRGAAHHGAGVGGVVGAAGVDGVHHDRHEGVQQVGQRQVQLGLVQAYRRQRGQGPDDVFPGGIEGDRLAVLQGVDEQQYPDGVAGLVRHGRRQHGPGAGVAAGVVGPDGCEVIALGGVHVGKVDQPALQRGAGADVVRRQGQGRQPRLPVPADQAFLRGPDEPAVAVQTAALQDVDRAAAAVGQMDGLREDAVQQPFDVPLRGQRNGDFDQSAIGVLPVLNGPRNPGFRIHSPAPPHS